VSDNGTAASPPVPGPAVPAGPPNPPYGDPRVEAAYDGGELAYDPGAAHRYADGRAPAHRPPVSPATFPDGMHAPDGGWRRVLLKLSGEALAGEGGIGVDPDVVARIAAEIAAVVRAGVQVAVVVGGGNYFRGEELAERGMERARADYMGILGTVMNCLALQDFLEKQGVETRVQTAITMGQVAEPYIPRRAIRHLEKGRVVIFGGGLGVPFFSTDTCAAQRALEIGCQVLLMGKNGVRGVYDADPKLVPDAAFFESLQYDELLKRGLRVADATAVSLCMDNHLPIVVFDVLTEGNITRAVAGERIGTLVSSAS